MNWICLPDVSSNFDDKVAEIKQHISLLKKLLARDAKVSYRQGWHTKKLELTHELTHPLKAGVTLMMYNFMESVGNAIMRDIHKHLKDSFDSSPWRLNEANAQLQQKIISYAKNQKNLVDNLISQYEMISPSNSSIILQLWISEKYQASIEDMPQWFNGNLDAKRIGNLASDYGFETNRLKKMRNVSGSSLLATKTNRNQLAHGAKTFTEFGQGKSLEEIENDFKNILNFFRGLLKIINDYLMNAQYRQNSCQQPHPT